MRGQAAMEYLVTYGWAIAAVLVVIGGFSYFGLTQTDQYIPTSCTASGDFVCTDFEVVEQATNFFLSNTARQDRIIEGVTIRQDGDIITCEFRGVNEEENEVTVSPGGSVEIGCPTITNPGDRVRLDFDIRYKVSDGGFIRRAEGSLIGQSVDREETAAMCDALTICAAAGICGTTNTANCGTVDCSQFCEQQCTWDTFFYEYDHYMNPCAWGGCSNPPSGICTEGASQHGTISCQEIVPGYFYCYHYWSMCANCMIVPNY